MQAFEVFGNSAFLEENMFTYSDYVESAAVLREKLSGFKPDVLIILGSGLGSLGENVQNPIFIDYGEIPRMRTKHRNRS